MNRMNPNLLISGSYNAFDEWNGAGIYMFSGTYKSQTIAQPIYIGSSNNLSRRIQYQHLNDLRKDSHCNIPLQNSFNKYGEEQFVVWCLETVTNDNLLIEREQYWLEEYRPFADEFNGFNVCKTAGKGPDNLGKKASDETKRKMSEAHKGKIKSQSHLDNIAEARSKHFKLISPSGEVIEGKNLSKFCRERSFNQSNLSAVIRGERKSAYGYTLPMN